MTALSLSRARAVSNRLLQAAALLAVPALTGCMGGKPAPTTQAIIQTAPAPVAEGPADATANPDSGGPEMDAVGKKVQAYTKALEPLLNHKPGTTQTAVVPSAVEWVDPGALSLDPVVPGKNAKGAGVAKAIGRPATGAPGGASIYATPPGTAPNGAAGVLPPGKINEIAQKTLAPASGTQGAQANVPLTISDAVVDVSDHPTLPGGITNAPAVQGPLTPTNELERKFAQRVKEYPRDVAGQLEYQMLLYLMNEQVPRSGPLAALPPEDRELVNSVVDGLSNFRTTLRLDNNMLLGGKIRPLLELADRLRQQADLSIATVALCREVKSFGNYEPIDPVRFEAGKETPVILYCEIENFTSQLATDAKWQTKLSQGAILYTETGVQVWNDPPTTSTDESRNRRHDFFLAKKIVLPSKLVIGRYLLKITVTDQQANRVTESTLPIVIAAQ